MASSFEIVLKNYIYMFFLFSSAMMLKTLLSFTSLTIFYENHIIQTTQNLIQNNFACVFCIIN